MFEDYLKEIHAKEYHGTDDAMSDAFEAWLMEWDTNEIMEHADEAMKQLNERLAGLIGAVKKAIEELEKTKSITN